MSFADSLSIPERNNLHSSMYLGMFIDFWLHTSAIFYAEGGPPDDHGTETGMWILLSKLKFTSIFLLESLINVEMLALSIFRCWLFRTSVWGPALLLLCEWWRTVAPDCWLLSMQMILSVTGSIISGVSFFVKVGFTISSSLFRSIILN